MSAPRVARRRGAALERAVNPETGRPAVDFAVIGEPLTKRNAPAVIETWLTERGWTWADVKTEQLRVETDCQVIHEHWPASWRGDWRGDEIVHTDAEGNAWRPHAAIIYADPADPGFAIARLFYDPGSGGDAPKYLTPKGQPVHPIVPRSAQAERLANPEEPLFVVEGYLKAVIASRRGLNCIGVNGHAGWKVKEAHLDPKGDAAQARSIFQEGLHPYLLEGREVIPAFDADAESNIEVGRSLTTFMDGTFRGFGCRPVWYALPDLGDGKSGLDDFLVEHSAEDVLALPSFERTSRRVRILRSRIHELTENGLAARFVEVHGDNVRRDPKSEEWYAFEDNIGWNRGDRYAEQAMLDSVELVKSEADAAHGEAAKKSRTIYSKTVQQRRTFMPALATASSSKNIEIDGETFDSDANLFGVRNGIVNLSDSRLLTPSRELRVIMRAPFKFDPTARSKLFEEFISNVVDGDRELRRHIQEVCGTLLAGSDMRRELLFAHGPAYTGKSVLLEIFQDGLGEYSMATKAAILMSARQKTDAEGPTPFLMSLRNRRAIICSELQRDEMVNEALIKDLVGGDTISARDCHGKPVTFRNRGQVIIRANHLPHVISTDTSIWSRLGVLPMFAVIPEAKRDPELRSNIAREFPGVFNWSLVGLHRFIERGHRFDLPKVCTDTMREWRAKADTLGAWTEDCLAIDPAKDTEARELQAEVTSCYMQWAKDNGHQPLSAPKFWDRMRERLGREPIKKSGGEKFAVGFRLRRPTPVINLYRMLESQNDQLKGENDRLRRAAIDQQGGTEGTQIIGKLPH
ncbi:MAG TPA: phage/plasmid primase, P4 family [Steroidobacteraceae bacterium]|jgi:putative DNA primase/helicase|nr:phage/plasmid primase, P4 family [Steroidobacteraceae bacterium]